MDEQTKILDVAYGSFSCRLEGFDDSVEVMKAVVAYFHDLAGHDRFMDMDPQAPDIETLARLTEEQSGQPVEVDPENGSVSMRVNQTEEAEDRPSLRMTPARDVARPQLADDHADPEALNEEEDDSLAPEANLSDTAKDEDVAADDIAVEDTEDRATEEQTVDDDVDVEANDNIYADKLDASAEEDEQFDPINFDASVAEKLQRIRTVVGKGDAVDDDMSATEDAGQNAEDEDAPSRPASNPLTQRLAELANRNAAVTAPEASDEDAIDDVAEDAQLQEDAVAVDDTENDAAADLPDIVDDEEDLIGAPDITDEEDVGSFADDVAALDDDDDKMAEADADDAIADDDMVEADLPADDDAEDDLEELAALEDELDALEEDLANEDEEQPVEVVADEQSDILQLTEADVAIEDDAPEEVAAKSAGQPKALLLTPTEEYEDDDDSSVLRASDDEFNLQEGVAKADAEIKARPSNEVAHHGLPRSVEDAMSRIMSQTDQHLNRPESRRHRDAFAQLKAAVAATEAARQLGDPGAQINEDSEDAFKDDLGAHDAEEKAAAAPETPPLKLIKNDNEHAKAGTKKAKQLRPAIADKSLDPASERLLQIAAQKEADSLQHTGGFAAFAAEHSTEDLVDLLEAAAAYITFVEGDEDFSRPQVMKKVQEASETEFTREDGLRSFGRLLRQSKITKLNNGRFQISPNTRFRPGDDHAAQGSHT